MSRSHDGTPPCKPWCGTTDMSADPFERWSEGMPGQGRAFCSADCRNKALVTRPAPGQPDGPGEVAPCPACYEGSAVGSTGRVLGAVCRVCDGSKVRPPAVNEPTCILCGGPTDHPDYTCGKCPDKFTTTDRERERLRDHLVAWQRVGWDVKKRQGAPPIELRLLADYDRLAQALKYDRDCLGQAVNDLRTHASTIERLRDRLTRIADLVAVRNPSRREARIAALAAEGLGKP
jgi:hypothetical protein